MDRPLKILLLEDSRTDAELIQRLLKKEKMNFEFHLSMNKADFLQSLEEFSPDVILSDNSMPKFDATEALEITRQWSLHIPFILVTGTVSEEFAANIIKQGADDYILKDRMTRLPGAIEATLKQRKIEVDLLETKRKAQLKIIATALKAQEKERNAIGQELHDNVNQILVGTKMILSMAKNYPDRIDEIINSSIKNLQEAIEENRKIAHELVTPDFNATSLVDQISGLTEIMLKTSGLDTFIDTSRLQEDLLDEDQKLTIYRIAQEQCTNIIKYAKARLVNISLATNDNFFKMIIADDGKGMETGKKIKGIGLSNIKGRLSIFNGTADVSTAPDKGFALEVIIPL